MVSPCRFWFRRSEGRPLTCPSCPSCALCRASGSMPSRPPSYRMVRPATTSGAFDADFPALVPVFSFLAIIVSSETSRHRDRRTLAASAFDFKQYDPACPRTSQLCSSMVGFYPRQHQSLEFWELKVGYLQSGVLGDLRQAFDETIKAVGDDGGRRYGPPAETVTSQLRVHSTMRSGSPPWGRMSIPARSEMNF